MSSAEDEAKQTASDLSDIFTTRYDDLLLIQTDLRSAFVELNSFYAQESGDKKLIFQYEKKNQYYFITSQQTISSSLEAVYPVLRDINETFVLQQSQLEQQAKSSTVPTNQPIGSPNITINPPQQRSFFSFFSKPKVQQENLPRSLEDAWTMTKELHITTMNVPNLWQKYLDWHYKGVMRQKLFGGGMQGYLHIEIWYLNAILEPLVTKLVQRAIEVSRTKHISALKDVYTKTMETTERIEQTKAFAGQMAGAGFGSGKPNP